MSLLGTVVGQAYVLIRPDTSSFSKDLTAQVNSATSAVSTTSSAAARVGKDIAAGLGVATVAAVDLGAKLQAAHAQLVAASDSTGTPFSAVAANVAHVDQQMERFGITNAQTEQGLARLTATTGNTLEALKAYPAVVEVARATNHTLTQELKDFTDASQGNYSALERTGIVTKEQVKNFHSYSDAIDYITKKFGPLAEAQAQSFQGQLSADKATGIDDLAKAGERLIPVIEGAGHVFVDFSKFLADNKVVAEDLAIVLGGGVAVALGAYTVAAGRAISARIGDAWSTLTGLGDRLAGVTRQTTVATEEQATASAGSASAGRAEAAALAALTEEISALVVPVQDLAVATQQLAANQAGATAEATGFSQAVAEQQAEVNALLAGLAGAEEQLVGLEAAWNAAAESEAASTGELSALVAEFVAADAGIDALIGQVDGLIAAEQAAIASGDGFSAEFNDWVVRANLAREALAGLQEQMAVLDAGMAGTTTEVTALDSSLAETETTTAAVGGGFADLAGPLGAALALFTAYQLAQSVYSQGAARFQSAEAQKIQSIQSLDGKIRQVTADLKEASDHQSIFAKAANDVGKTGHGVTSWLVQGEELATGTWLFARAAKPVEGAFDSSAQKVKALKNELKSLQAEQRNQAAAAQSEAVTAYWTQLAAAVSNVTSAESANEAAQQKVSAAQNTYLNDVQRITDAQDTLTDAYHTLADAQVQDAVAQQNFNEVMSRSGQYALDLAAGENRLTSDSTSLLSAQTALRDEQQKWSDIVHDTGTYLLQQQQAELSLAQAKQQVVVAGQQELQAEQSLHNLLIDNQSAISALSEAHGNLNLAQELANIQAGDSLQNQQALQQAQDNLASATLEVQSASLQVTSAQQNLTAINNEAVAGTIQYDQQLVALQQAQEGVSQATNQQASDQLAYQNLLDESIPGTLEYRQQVDTLTNAQYQYSKAVEAIPKDQNALRSAVSDTAKAYYDLSNAETAAIGPAQALAQAEQTLHALQGMLMTPGGSPLPATRVSAYATGGDIAAGEVGLVGENGPELYVAKSAGTIIPTSALGTSGPGGGLSLSIADLTALQQTEGSLGASMLTLAQALNQFSAARQPVQANVTIDATGSLSDQHLAAAVAAQASPVIAGVLATMLGAG